MRHIGKLIEDVVRSQRWPIKEFASKLNTDRRNIYNIFNRESIDTSLLMKISELLNHNFFLYFEPKINEPLKNQLIEEQLISKTNPPQQEISELKEKFNQMQKELEEMRELMSKMRAVPKSKKPRRTDKKK